MQKEVYEGFFERLNLNADFIKNSTVGAVKPTNPLLIATPELYFSADIKIMIFGQETNDWGGDFPRIGGIDRILKTYKDFFTTGDCYSYGGQFWNGISKLKNKMQQEHSGQSVEIIWNNIVKIGKSGEKGLPSKDIIEWQSCMFEVIKLEVDYYKPDIVVFFTGPYYDRFILRAFEDAVFLPVEGKTKRQFAKVESLFLPAKTIRTYHPNYLWRNSFYDYLSTIVKEIKV